jgi:L-ascorbate metabolism protein UlaG (beta-lactamase superfamily)
MNEQKLYLKPNVVIEPLIDRWHAWSHLISPGTAAMNIVHRHIKIMQSYIEAPEVHAEAILNPNLRGGPFMDFKEDRIEEVKNLMTETIKTKSLSIQLSQAITDLDLMLKKEAKGYSLESLYEKVPDMLKGYVELVYDLNNSPSFRFFEYLLYGSDFYNKNSQSISLWLTENDDRPFCLSTPRLDDPAVLYINIPFDHTGIDLLSKMKRMPDFIDSIADVLGIQNSQRKIFDTFFTQKSHPPYQKYNGDLVRMRYFGHACILIETKNISILIDPLISYYGYDSGINHFSDINIPDTIDYVLITHNHQDHIMFETLLPLRHKIKNIIVPGTNSGTLQDPNLKLMFNAIGFTNVMEIYEMEEIVFGNCTITGIPFTGEHCDLNIKTKSCFHVRVDNFKFFFVADSRIIEHRLYEHIHRKLGDVDIVFMGMECDGAPLTWLYGPLLTTKVTREEDQSRRLSGSDYKKGIKLVDIFNPSEVYVYAMGQEPWVTFISSIKYTKESNPIIQSDILVQECRKRGLISERLYGEKELLYNSTIH